MSLQMKCETTIVVETPWNTCVTAVGLSQKIALIQSHICIEQYDGNATGEQKEQYEIKYNLS